MKNTLYFSSLVIVLVGAIVVSVMTASSFEFSISLGNYLDRRDNILNLTEEDNYTNTYFKNNIQSFQELKDQSALIVKIKPTNERLNYAQAVHTAVQVQEVYQGNQALKDTKIYIFEPSYFYSSIPVYFSFGGYQIMQEDKEYVLFLNHLKAPEGYSYKGNEEITFVPVSTYYGKFPILNNQEHIEKQHLSQKEVDNGIPFEQIKDREILTTNEKVAATYNEIKQTIHSKIGINN